jgi:hypothetical protein
MADGLVDIWMDGWTDGWRHKRTDVDGIKDEEGNGRMVQYVDDILDDRCNERRWNTLYEATGR